jgi:rubrerythrin
MDMEALDVAIKMEQDGQRFYREAVRTVRDEAAQRMLNSLADDEQRHETIVRSMKGDRPVIVDSDAFAGIKNVFQKLVEEGRAFFNEDDNLSEVLTKATLMEQKSVRMYGDLARAARLGAEKEIWQRLQREEQRHEQLLSVTLEYIDEPATVLENVEFSFYGRDKAP